MCDDAASDGCFGGVMSYHFTITIKVVYDPSTIHDREEMVEELEAKVQRCVAEHGLLINTDLNATVFVDGWSVDSEEL